MAGQGAFSWNSELPSGHNPFWIRDEALAGLGLHVGDAVGVDTRAEPRDGDLVVAEVELDGDSIRTSRRYSRFVSNGQDRVRLEGVGGSVEAIEVGADEAMVMGVVMARLRFPEGEATPIEEPLA